MNRCQLMHFLWARNPTRDFKFIRLAQAIFEFDEKYKKLWLNIVETFFCGVFQSLQPETLKHYFGFEIDPAVRPCGLNVSLPIHEGFVRRSVFQNFAVWRSGDPEAAAFARKRHEYYTSLAYAANVRLHWVPQARTMRPYLGRRREGDDWGWMRKTTRSTTWKLLFREANTSLGDPVEVEVHCHRCGWSKIDDNVVIHIHTGTYIARMTRCDLCPPAPYEVQKGHTRGSG